MRALLAVAILVLAGCTAPGPVATVEEPQGPDCPLHEAHAWREALGDAPVWTRTLQGTLDGQPVHETVAVDQQRRALSVEDHHSGVDRHALGPVAVEEVAMRRDGGDDWLTLFLLEDRLPFPAPAHALTAACGTDGSVLLHHNGTLAETWRFGPDGRLLEARLTGPGTDLVLHHQDQATFTDLPDATRTPTTLGLRLLASSPTDDGREDTIALGPSTVPVAYADLQVHYLDADGHVVLAVDVPRLHDGGQPDVADVGDTWTIRLRAPAVDWRVHDAWAGAYVQDADDGDEAEPAPLPPPPEPDGDLVRRYAWDFEGRQWNWRLEMPEDLYTFYQERPFVYDDRGRHAYDAYVSTPYDDTWIAALAGSLQGVGDQEGWDDATVLSFALAFVQSLPYAPDDVTTGFDEFPRYPILTLVDEGGDCEDTSILFAAIAQALGHEVVLLSPPRHMAVGVRSSDAGDGVVDGDGTTWRYAETTGQGWRLGEVPEEYEGTEMRIFPLQPMPIMELSKWRLDPSPHSGHQQARITVTNLGSAPAKDAVLRIYLVNHEDHIQDQAECAFTQIKAGDEAWCEAHLRLPGAGKTVQAVFRVEADGVFLQERSHSWTT